MVKNFKFFHGIVRSRRLTAVWTPQEHVNDGLDVTSELTRLMSEQIAQEIDSEIINTLTRRINGGSNHGIDYLNHWMTIGGNRA